MIFLKKLNNAGIGRFAMQIIAAVFLCTQFCTTVAEQKTIVFIVGAPRSGTSATTAFLQILGLDIGNNLIGPHESNAKGHFEDASIVKINNAILSAFKSHPQDIKPLPSGWLESKTIVRFKSQIISYLKQMMSTRSVFGFKDPRISSLLPLYTGIATELGYDIKIVVVKRNIEEIVLSHAKRTNMPREQALALTNKHWTAIERDVQGFDYKEVQFNDVLYKTELVAQQLKDFLPFLHSYDAVVQEITNFLDPDLKHHNLG